MEYINNRSLIFPNKMRVTIVWDDNYLLKDKFDHIQKLIKSCIAELKKPKTEDRLKKYINRFPKEPYFYKILAEHYIERRNNDNFRASVEHYFEKFPNDYFAKQMMAGIYVVTEEFDKIELMYGKNIDLAYAYPDRDTFHISEILGWLYFCVLYCLKRKLLDDAIRNIDMIRKIAPDSETYRKAMAFYKDHLEKGEPMAVSISNDFKIVQQDFKLTDEIVTELNYLNYKISTTSVPDNALLQQIKSGKIIHQNIPFYSMLLLDYYQQFNERKNYVALVDAFYQEHKEYLGAKIAIAFLLLDAAAEQEHVPKVIFSLFGNDFDMSKLKPSRTQFLHNEIIGFKLIALRTWLRENQLSKAFGCLDTLEKIEGKDGVYYKDGRKHIDRFLDAQNIENKN